MQNKRIQQWAMSIAGYNCTIEYIKGSDNSAADLLSRLPEEDGNIEEDTDVVEVNVAVNDKNFQIGAINSDKIDLRPYASCKIVENDCLEETELGFKEVDDELDMAEEQKKDADIVEIRKDLEEGRQNKKIRNPIVVENILYYISNNTMEDPVLRLYIPVHLRDAVLIQYHDKNGHMGVDKTYDAIKIKYYWPKLYQEIYMYIGRCVRCQQRSSRSDKLPMQETDIPPFPLRR